MNSITALPSWNWQTTKSSTESNPIVMLQTEHPLFQKKFPTVVVKNTDSLSQKVAAILGKNGVKRFAEFRQYREGWDSGTGKPMSLRSVGVLEFFIHQFDSLPTEPSLFLTREGNLQLGWEDAAGEPIELEFFPDRIEYFIGSKHEEGHVSINALNTLVAKLRVILA